MFLCTGIIAIRGKGEAVNLRGNVNSFMQYTVSMSIIIRSAMCSGQVKHITQKE